jgi:NAD-dependent SIR2 family protein deacetylase
MKNVHTDIKKAIKDNKLVFFVGAGFSQPLGFPNWTNLTIDILKALSENYPKMGSLIELFESGTFDSLGVLKIIKEHKREIYDILDEKFKMDDDKKQKLHRHKLLWEISDKIITTNYDTALETAHPGINKVVYNNDFRIAKLSSQNNYLFKLHGCIDDPTNCILFEEDYKNLYCEQKQKSPIFELEKIISDKTIIFLGFSLKDPYVEDIFVYMYSLYSGIKIKHFLVSTKPDDLSKCGIETIKIDNCGEELDTFLNNLLEIKKTVKTPVEEISTTLEPPEHIKQQIIIQNKIKIAILIASPIDKQFKNNFNEIIKEFNVLSTIIDCFCLSLKNLNLLEGYDYVFMFSQTYNNKIYIEDEYLRSKLMDIKELEENLYRHKGVFLMLDNIIDVTKDEISCPLVITKYDKNILNDLITKAFIRKDINQILKSYTCINKENIVLEKIKIDKSTLNKNRTPLPNLIDSKNLTNFVGRVIDLENVIRRVIDLRVNEKILTIKGSGGIGKTTLAKKASLELSERNFFRNGIYFIECEHLSTYQSFEYKIAQCFGIDSSINFIEHVKINNMNSDSLIILDNLETLLYLDDSEKIKELIRFISDYASIVTTSREPIRFEFEDVYPLGSFTTDEAELLFKKYYTLEGNEIKVLRADILENLLNNNPLAIMIITKNLPLKKDVSYLKKELEEDFFKTTSEGYENIFEKETDANIEKSKSLFQSINYSYNKLTVKEKLAFEILSLFPDVINMENLKLMIRKADIKNDNSSQISDREIKNLELKSLIEESNHLIKLQSIIRKFAEYCFNKRTEKEKSIYYKEAYLYNEFELVTVNEIHKDNDSFSLEIFYSSIKNFYKSLGYIDKFESEYIPKKNKLLYIGEFVDNYISVSQNKDIIVFLDRLESYFDTLEYGKLYILIHKISVTLHKTFL